MSRIATGLRRPKPFQICLDHSEKEYLMRAAYDCEANSAAAFIRKAIFTKGWMDRLLELRVKQRNLPQERFAQKM